MTNLRVAHLGPIPYRDGLALQEGLVRARAEGRTGDWLLYPDHPPVLTVGRNPSPGPRDSLMQSREDVERTTIQRALMNCGYTRARAANALGISRVTLYKKMKKYGLMEAVAERAQAV